MTIRFYKEEDDFSRRWYADLEGFPKADLEMVHGADSMLDIITSMQEDSVTLEITTEPREVSWQLLLEKEGDPMAEGGGYYTFFFEGNIFLKNVWLCEVTRAVYGGIPTQFYISPVFNTHLQ